MITLTLPQILQSSDNVTDWCDHLTRQFGTIASNVQDSGFSIGIENLSNLVNAARDNPAASIESLQQSLAQAGVTIQYTTTF